MILVAAVAVSVLVALLRGGRLTRLADLRIEHAWAVLAALALQLPVVYLLVGEKAIGGLSLGHLVLAASYALLFWVVWANRRLPGLPLVGLGLVCNSLVMALNGGWMPITAEAVARLEYPIEAPPSGAPIKLRGGKNVLLPRSQTRLWWLSDVFVLGPPFPVVGAFSIGDLLIAAGIFWLLQWALVAPRRVDSG